MAVGEMDDFLKKYYRRLHTKSMPEEVLARLVDDKKNGLLTGHQQEWFNDFLEEDANSPLGYKAKDLPKPNEPAELKENELIKLYKSFAVALAGMKNASIFYDNVNDAAALQFVKIWMDERQVFEIPHATDECETSINKIINVLDTSPKALNIKQIIVDNAKKANGDKAFDDVAALNKLIGKCTDKKYNSDTSVQEKIQIVARTLRSYLYSYESERDPNIDAVEQLVDDLNIVAREDAFSNIKYDTHIDDFKIYAEELLDTLYYDKSIREKFQKYDSSKITEKIDKAESKIAWHDSKSDDYVKPKIDDVRTPLQQIQKWVSDTYEDTLKKYEELRGGHLFFNSHAKEIFKAIDKVKIKPVDGLPALLEKAATVKGKISNKTVGQYFDWFIETMNNIKDDIPLAIEGAWKDSNQMKCVIEHIILKATDPRNQDPLAMDKARTAMEIMTAMKYGMMTSKIMDAIKGTDFNLFSDKDLSWNKNNEGIQLITRAFDKTVKAAFLGIGYGVTIIKNKISLSGGKFNNKDNTNGLLASRFADEKSRLDRSGRLGKTGLQNFIAAKRTELHTQEQIRQNLIRNGFDLDIANTQKDAIDLQLERHKQSMETANEDKNKYQQNMDKYAQQMQQHQNAKQAYDNAQKIIDQEDINEIDNEIQKLQQKEKRLTTELDNPKDSKGALITNARLKSIRKRDLAAQITSLMNQITQKRTQKTKLEADYSARKTNAQQIQTQLQPEYDAYNSAQQQYNQAQTQYTTADKQYNKAKNEYDKISKDNDYQGLTDKINQFEEATKSIDEINETIEQKQAALDNWDAEHSNKILELENYWNFLQTGHTTTWRFNTKTAQKQFDAQKNVLLANYTDNYGLVA